MTNRRIQSGRFCATTMQWLSGLLALFCGVAAFSLTAPLSAADGETGSGKRQYRNDALQSIPYQELNQQTRATINEVLNKPSIYRRLPITTINADPEYFRYLVRYPEVIVNIWQLMGVTQMTTERTGPFTIDTDDGVGTISSLELVYGNENLHIFYGTGSYEGSVLKKKLTGSCVLILRSEYSNGAAGKTQTTSKLDVFLKVENATLGLIAKTIQPIVGSTADHNFVESLKFVQRLQETTEKNGPGVQQMANRLSIDDDVRKGYVKVAGDVYEKALDATVAPSYQSMIGGSVPVNSRRGAAMNRQMQPSKSQPIAEPNRVQSYRDPGYGNQYQPTSQPIPPPSPPSRSNYRSQPQAYPANSNYRAQPSYPATQKTTMHSGQRMYANQNPNYAGLPPIVAGSQNNGTHNSLTDSLNSNHHSVAQRPTRSYGYQAPMYQNQMADDNYPKWSSGDSQSRQYRR